MKFEFLAGRMVLDFVATVSDRGRTNVERLQSPADFTEWVALARLVDQRVTLTDAELIEVRRVREALYGLIRAVTEGREVPTRDRWLVNAAAAMNPPSVSLTSAQQVRRDGDLDAVLALLARDAVDLVDSPDRQLVRWCDDSSCTRPFLDRSRGRRRRWCGMAGCGDRAKAAAYRRRHRDRA